MCGLAGGARALCGASFSSVGRAEPCPVVAGSKLSTPESRLGRCSTRVPSAVCFDDGTLSERHVVRVDLDEKKIDLQMVGLKQSAKKFGKSKAKIADSKKPQSKKEKHAKKKIDSSKKPKPSKKLKHKKRQANAQSKSGKGTAATKTRGKKASAESGKPKKKPSSRRSKKPNAKPRA